MRHVEEEDMTDTQHAYEPLRLDELDAEGALREAADGVATTTRGALLRRAGAGGAVLLAGLGGGAARARAQMRSGDAAILNYALVLEYLQSAFYSEAERAGALNGPLAHQAQVVGAHERAHVDALRGALGRQALRRPSFDFRGVTEDPGQFRRTAVAFEDLATAAYKAELPRIRSDAVLAAAVRIHSVEARHAAWIRRLAGRVPSPSAFDDPVAQREVTHIVAGTHFVTSAPKTSGRGNPQFTG